MNIEKIEMKTENLVDKNVENIANLFPNCITEKEDGDGKLKKAVNFKILQQMLTEDAIAGPEAYEFTWVGKNAAIAEANRPIEKTLRPCKEESVDWEKTENLYIEGDNLDVLKLLQKSYLNKVKLIYIDPPYNTGNDLIYNDNRKWDKDEYDIKSGCIDENGVKLFTNTTSNGRFHSDWCTMIYSRLLLARNLLTDDGVLFISIDENEIENLTKICTEIMGEGSFIDCITWNTRVPKNDNYGIGHIHQYILVYSKASNAKRRFKMLKDGLDDVFDFINELKAKHLPIPDAEKELKQYYNKKGYDRGITLYCNLDDDYRPWGKINMSWPNTDTFGPRFDVLHPATGKAVKVPGRGWRWNKETFASHLDYNNVKKRYDGSYVCGDIWFSDNENIQPSSITYLSDVSNMLLRSIVSLKSDGGLEVDSILDENSIFSHPKPVSLLKLLLGSIEEKSGIFLDFFSGSGTTAQAIMELNNDDGGDRHFIMVQIPEPCKEKSPAYKAGFKTIAEIGKKRIRMSGTKYFSNNQQNGLDVGFRVLKLDDWNKKDVMRTPSELQQSELDNYYNATKDERADLDLLFGCLIEEGVELTKQINEEMIDGIAIQNYNEGWLIGCFADNVPESVIRKIAERKPRKVVFKDSSFQDSPAKINVTEIFKMISPDTTIKVI